MREDLPEEFRIQGQAKEGFRNLLRCILGVPRMDTVYGDRPYVVAELKGHLRTTGKTYTAEDFCLPDG